MRNLVAAGLAGILALSLATPVLARTEAKTETAAVAQVQGGGAATSGKAEERKVCRQLQMTGTRMKNQRVCHTKAEWQKIEAEY